MHPPSSISNFDERGRRALGAMVLALVLAVAVDVACRLTLPENELAYRYRTARELLASEETPDVEIVGDSATWSALLASALATDGIYVRNDALGGARPPLTYYLLKEQFRRGHVPKAIVFGHLPGSFDDPFTGRMTGTFARWSELPEIAIHTTQWNKVALGVLSRFSYTFMNHDEFRKLFIYGDYRHFVAPESTFAYHPVPDLERLETYAVAPGSDPAAEKNMDRQTVFTTVPETDLYFRKTLALAKEHGVKVFWLTMPAPASLYRERETNGFYEAMYDYLQQFVDSGELTLLPGEKLSYVDSFFHDNVHMKLRGTIEYSCGARRYAAVIAKAIGPPDGQVELTPARVEQRRAAALLDEACAGLTTELLSGGALGEVAPTVTATPALASP